MYSWIFYFILFFKGFFFKDFIYLFLDRGEGREKEWERNINVWLPLAHPLQRTWLATQACAQTRNWTMDPLVCRPALNPLSHSNQGMEFILKFYDATIIFVIFHPCSSWTFLWHVREAVYFQKFIFQGQNIY